MLKPIVSFITINYNSSLFTIELLKSIIQFTTLNYEIIIIDNDSKYEDIIQLEMYLKDLKNVKLIKNKLNEGFATANMLGYKYANGEYLLFINNDTQLLNDITKLFYLYLEIHQDTALVSGKIKDQKGNYSSSYKLFPSLIKEMFGNTIARKFSKHNFPSNKTLLNDISIVEVVSGSCMFFRKSDFHNIGGFDKDFFLYCEEEDISKRIWESGKNIVFIPEAEILHYSGGSTKKSFEIEREYYISYIILLNKHFNYVSSKILLFFVLIKLFRRSFKREYGFKLFKCMLKGCKKKDSLRYKYIMEA